MTGRDVNKRCILISSDSDSDSDSANNFYDYKDELISKNSDPPLDLNYGAYSRSNTYSRMLSSSPTKENPKGDDGHKRKTKNVDKQLLKEQKNLLKEQKQQERARKKELASSIARLRPENCMNYIFMVVDQNLINCNFASEIFYAATKNGAKSVVRPLPIPNTVTWTRKILNPAGVEVEEEEKQVLLIWSGEQVVNLIESNKLSKNIASIQNSAPDKTLTLAIFDLETHLRANEKKTKKLYKAKVLNEVVNNSSQSNGVTREKVTDSLVELQLINECSSHLVNTIIDVGDIVFRFTKAVAETPFKLEKQRQQIEGLGWFASCDIKEIIRVNKSGNGLLNLWQHQLMQFNNCGIDVVQAITQKYPTPTSLFQAYNKCKSVEEGELLLQDLVVRRGFGEVATSRRVGQELSKKVYRFFTTMDGDLKL